MPAPASAPAQAGHTLRATDLHRVYIQTLLARRAIRDTVALELYKRAISACQGYDPTFRVTHPPTIGGLNAFLEDISTLLHDVGMEIKKGKEETGRGKGWIVLVNNDPTEAALQSTDYPSLDIDYYRKVIEAIIISYPANSIAHGQALSLVSELESNMTRSAAESLLSSLVSRGWLSKSKRGRYALGVRAVLELEPYLRAEYEEYMQSCKQCKRTVTAGVACPNVDCDVHWHGYCYESHLRIPRASCPECGTPHAGLPGRLVGEKSVSTTEDGFRGLKKRKKSLAGAKGKNRAAEDGDGTDADEDDELEDEDEGEGEVEESGSGFIDGAGPSGWRVDSSSRRRKSVVPETQYDDEDEEGEEESEESRPKRRARI